MRSDIFSLALGGGAARGLAHIGVIQRLEELKIEPKMVSGTSMGAIIAAFYALGYTSSEMKEIVKHIKIMKLLDFDMVHGLIRGKKILSFLQTYIGEKEFQDTKIPLTIIATDIDTGTKVIFREGKIITALRASISIPGVFAPHNHNHQNLVDGGLTENLPISVLPDMKIIAVSVQLALVKKKKKQDFFSKMFAKSMILNSYSILRNTVAILLAQNEQASLKSRSDTLLIRPERYDIDYYDFTRVQELIDAGYKASQEIESFLSQR